jgi:hypothetical protein
VCKRARDGRHGWCRACKAEAARRWYAEPENRAKVAESDRRWYSNPENRAKRAESRRRWLERPESRAKRAEANRRYRKTPEGRAKRSEEHRRRRQTNPQARLANLLRTRLRSALKGTVKSARTMELLGCPIEHLVKHLESKFLPGMSWQNHGEWHVDHIRPLASFNLTDPEQQRQACHWTNLQPLWAADNIIKGAKHETPSHPEGNTGKEVGANRTIAEPHSPGFFDLSRGLANAGEQGTNGGRDFRKNAQQVTYETIQPQNVTCLRQPCPKARRTVQNHRAD